MKPSFLPTVFHIFLLLSVFSISSWAQAPDATKLRTAKTVRQMRPTERTATKAAPKPVSAAPVAPAQSALNRSVRVSVSSTLNIPSRATPPAPARPDDAYQRDLQERMVHWHPIEISFQLLTSMSWNSASGNGAALYTRNLGSGLRTSVGPNIDLYFFRDRYAFGTGLWYTIRRVGYSQPADLMTNPSTKSRTSAFNLQYLQIPLTMKLMSNTLFPTGRTYVQFGSTMDFKLAESPIDYANNYVYQRDGNIDQFTSASLSLLLAVGYMHRVSPTNDLIMTMQYQRSLTDNAVPDNLWSINQHFAFGIGLSF